MPAEKEFWEVWGEERAQAPGTPAPTDPAATTAPIVAPITETEGPPRERPASPREESQTPGTARLYLNLGRKDGAGEDQIRELLRDVGGIDQVSGIDVMNTHTYLDVASADADRLCAALSAKQLGERDLLCERARPRRR
jgi:hypothetical protein